MNKGRLEAFTDAIVAIAATIMVLELKTPLTNDWNGIKEILPTSAMNEANCKFELHSIYDIGFLCVKQLLGDAT